MNAPSDRFISDAVDRRIVVATQAGLQIVRRPYDEVAREVGVSTEEVIARMTRMLAAGAIRRIGLVPHHYALGYRFNGMSVWDVSDELVDALGQRIGAMPFVSHCYRRVRHLPEWPYNLFAMVHGKGRADVDAKVREIAALVGDADRGHDVLYSTRILKKTGLRLNPVTTDR